MSRAMHEIKADAYRLVQARLLGAIDADDWIAVARISEQLREIATRGMHHQSIELARAIGSSASLSPRHE